MDGGLPADGPGDWPTQSQVSRYKRRVRMTLDEALAASGLALWSGGEPAELLLNVAIEHRLMHAETLSYMLHQLPYENKRVIPQAPVPERELAGPAVIHIPAGRATLGLARHEVFWLGQRVRSDTWRSAAILFGSATR